VEEKHNTADELSNLPLDLLGEAIIRKIENTTAVFQPIRYLVVPY
jgi:hypothetical protein